MEDEGQTWDEFVDRFVTRFRPSNYEQQLLEQLMRPKQSDNEGVQKYADRYRRLHHLTEEAPANINTLAQ